MITLGVLLLIIYIFARHPLILGAGVLLVVLGLVFMVTAAGHYAYY